MNVREELDAPLRTVKAKIAAPDTVHSASSGAALVHKEQVRPVGIEPTTQ